VASEPLRAPGHYRNGTGGLEFVVYVSVFLANIRCNKVVPGLFGGICGQRPSCVLSCPLRFLTFPLAGGSEPSLGNPVPAPHHNDRQIVRIISWMVDSAFIHEDGKL
jgi:hypothetical protein